MGGIKEKGGVQFRVLGQRKTSRSHGASSASLTAELRMRFSRQSRVNGGRVTRDHLSATVAITVDAFEHIKAGQRYVLAKTPSDDLAIVRDSDIGRTISCQKHSKRMYITFDGLDPADFSDHFSISDPLDRVVTLAGSVLTDGTTVIFKANEE